MYPVTSQISTFKSHDDSALFLLFLWFFELALNYLYRQSFWSRSMTRSAGNSFLVLFGFVLFCSARVRDVGQTWWNQTRDLWQLMSGLRTVTLSQMLQATERSCRFTDLDTEITPSATVQFSGMLNRSFPGRSHSFRKRQHSELNQSFSTLNLSFLILS